MLTIAITGGVASGKSTVANLFAKYGIDIVDTDQIARDVVQATMPAYKSIVKHFGNTILLENQDLDRSKLREIIFANPDEKLWLEQLLHPLIREEMIAQVQQSTSPYCICLIPLLAESGNYLRKAINAELAPASLDEPLVEGNQNKSQKATYDIIDRVLVIDISEKAQLDRLIARDAISQQLAQDMINAQVSRNERLAIADDVIENVQDLEHLDQQVNKLHETYAALAST